MDRKRNRERFIPTKNLNDLVTKSLSQAPTNIGWLFCCQSLSFLSAAGYLSLRYYLEEETPNSIARLPVSPEETFPTVLDQDLAPTPAQTTSREDVIKALEWLAAKSLSQDRLIQPPADNAHYYYSRLFEMDKEKAMRGFSAIAQRFLVIAERELSSGNYEQAQTYVIQGLVVEPDNEALSALRVSINNR